MNVGNVEVEILNIKKFLWSVTNLREAFMPKNTVGNEKGQQKELHE